MSLRTTLSQATSRACRTVWGQSASYVAPNGADADVRVVFDDAHALIEWQDGMPVESTAPRAEFLASAVTPEKGGVLTVDGQDYEITSTEPDGHGNVACMLVEA